MLKDIFGRAVLLASLPVALAVGLYYYKEFKFSKNLEKNA